MLRVGISELKTQRFPSVAKHQQTQRYKKRRIIREVFAKKKPLKATLISCRTKHKEIFN